MKLDAGWQVAAAPAGAIADPAGLDAANLTWFAAQVPGTAAGALRAAGAWSFDTPRAFDADDWWWRCTVVGEARGTLALVCEGIATLSDVWWNGALVRSGTNMFVATRDRVEVRGDDTIVIRCRALAPELAKKRPRPRWRVPMLEQQQLRWFRTTLLGRTPGWSPSCPAVGPWRPISLEASAPPIVRARLDGDTGVVTVIAALDGATTAELVVSRIADGRVIEDAIVVDTARIISIAPASGPVRASRDATAPFEKGDGAWRAEVRIEKPARWWPHTHGEPVRYAIAMVVDGGAPISLGATGFRTVAVERDGGDFAVRVNGVRVFCRGACWTPLDVVSLAGSPTDAIAQVARANLNMIRVGGTMVYEDAAFYDALDEAGILLWQDLMFANMDYPDDDALRASIDAEVDQQLARLASHPCLAIVCGNSEGGQQAAMAGATRDRWAPPLFHVHLRDRVASALPDVPYVASSTDGGAYPHQVDSGVTSYYGVGAYLRPLDDARRSGLRFASEALAFANIPDDAGLAEPNLRVHHARWKARAPRDLGAGWDFDDVRDHYVKLLFGVDPTLLRTTDHERYLQLGRFATGEVMAQAFAEWRRGRSPTRGALIWFLRDLWPGAGWGLVDARGEPKDCWAAVARACAPRAIAITDEGTNGLVLHAANDRPDRLELALTATLYRAGEIKIETAAGSLAVDAHGTAELPLAALFEGWYDLSYAFRFGPPQADVVHVRATEHDQTIAEAFAFPVGFPARELDVGLGVTIEDHIVAITARRFAFGVSIEAPGFEAADRGFHLLPGDTRRIALARRDRAATNPPKGTVTALNSETRARFG